MSRVSVPPLSRISRKFATVRDIVQGCDAAADQYHVNHWKVWRRFLGLYSRRFSPREIFLWGLLDPSLGRGDLASYVSKEALLRLQRRHNPPEYANLVEDKAVFYPHCEGVGLPVPRLLATFNGDQAWLTEMSRFVSTVDLPEHGRRLGWGDFLVKPGEGVYGRGVRLVRDTAAGWADQFGSAFDTEGIAEYCRQYAVYRRFLLQERVHNHSLIGSLTGVDTLQTVRVITVAAGDGNPGEIVLANWRIAGRNGVTDNFDYGRGGNFLADVDVANGRIRHVVGPAPDRQGVEAASTHPVTGASLAGVTLPHWPLVREVVIAGTVHFAPLQLIGWDIALTESGPVLLEANAWFDAGQNAFCALPMVLEKTRQMESEGR